jgi:hypothetical protein
MKLGTAFSVGVLMVVSVAGCGGGSKPTTPQCSLNSDCAKLSTPGLVCALGYCVKPCNISSDCPTGQRCIVLTSTADAGADSGASTGGAGAGVAQGTACQAPELATCNYNSMCKAPLVCSSDHQCRDMCETNADCPGMGTGAGAQVCTSITHLCADPAVDKDYNSTINDFVVNDAGMGIPQGGNTGSGGSGTGHGGHGGTGGIAGMDGTVTSCPTKPQTNFAYYAQGDSNLHFTSGVGVRTADQLIIFSGYSGPPPAGFDGGVASVDAGADGGVPSVNLVYVQSFDPVTGTMTGPAAPVFQAADGKAFAVFDVSIAPTGEIVLLHGSNERTPQLPSTSFQDTLYASFFSPTSPGAPVHRVRTVQIESAPLGAAHATWSVPNQGAFALSWKYVTTAWVAAVKKFRPNGTQAGGDTGVVPAAAGYQSDLNTDDCHVGRSGNFFGVASRDPIFASNYALLTVLDGTGNQAGPIEALSQTILADNWMTVGGTSSGFVNLYRSGNTLYEFFTPTSGDAGVLPLPVVDGGDAGRATFAGFNFPTTAVRAHAINDDTGGAGGVGVVLLQSDVVNVLYVNADGVTHQLISGVISSGTGAEAAITNYQGSFGVSLYSASATNHSTQMVASICSP